MSPGKTLRAVSRLANITTIGASWQPTVPSLEALRIEAATPQIKAVLGSSVLSYSQLDWLALCDRGAYSSYGFDPRCSANIESLILRPLI